MMAALAPMTLADHSFFSAPSTLQTSKRHRRLQILKICPGGPSPSTTQPRWPLLRVRTESTIWIITLHCMSPYFSQCEHNYPPEIVWKCTHGDAASGFELH